MTAHSGVCLRFSGRTRWSCRRVRLRRLRCVAVEQLGEQELELEPFCRVQPVDQLLLDGVGVPLGLREVVRAGVGDADELAAAVCQVGPPVDVAPRFESVEDGVDVVAIQSEATA